MSFKVLCKTCYELLASSNNTWIINKKLEELSECPSCGTYPIYYLWHQDNEFENWLVEKIIMLEDKIALLEEGKNK